MLYETAEARPTPPFDVGRYEYSVMLQEYEKTLDFDMF